jgi:uncharacterized protein (DUF3084 family)
MRGINEGGSWYDEPMQNGGPTFIEWLAAIFNLPKTLQEILAVQQSTADQVAQLTTLLTADTSALATLQTSTDAINTKLTTFSGDLGSLVAELKTLEAQGSTGTPVDLSAVIAQATALQTQMATVKTDADQAAATVDSLDSSVKNVLNVPSAPTSSDSSTTS